MVSGRVAQFVYFRNQTGRDERQDLRMRFGETGEVEAVLLSFGGAARGVSRGPELSLDEVLQMIRGQITGGDTIPVV